MYDCVHPVHGLGESLGVTHIPQEEADAGIPEFSVESSLLVLISGEADNAVGSDLKEAANQGAAKRPRASCDQDALEGHGPLP